MRKTKAQKTPPDGFALRLILPIVLSVEFASLTIDGLFDSLFAENKTYLTICLMHFVSLIAFAVPPFLGAFFGRSRRWANILSIVFGALVGCGGILYSILYGMTMSQILILFTVSVLAIVGGALGLKALKQPVRSVPNVQETSSAAREASSAEGASDKRNALADFSVDYENKPTVSKVLDPQNPANLFLKNEDGLTVEIRQLYTDFHDGRAYFVGETVDLPKEDGGGIYVFLVDYECDALRIVEDEALRDAVYDRYEAKMAGADLGTKNVTRAEFELDLYDTSVDEKTWKEFKKTASQEELAVIALGAKYRIAHSRIKNILYAIGIILSVALLFVSGGYSLIAYPVFAFLATKSIRYQDTYNQSYRKLTPENKAFVNNCFNGNVGLTIVDGLVQFATFWLTLPYQAVMLFIGEFAPNFYIAKNGILVSLPNGFDVGNLGAVGAYYKSFNFIDEANSRLQQKPDPAPTPAADPNEREEFTYTDRNGYNQTVYIAKDGKEAYDAGGHYVGTVSGEGDERTFTPSS